VPRRGLHTRRRWPRSCRSVTHATIKLQLRGRAAVPGPQLHPALAAEVSTDTRRRPEGWRVKHRMERNSIKVYDKVIRAPRRDDDQQPHQFRILRAINGATSGARCVKGSNLPATSRSAKAPTTLLDALGTASTLVTAKQALHQLCRPRTNRGRHHGRFNPVDRTDVALFEQYWPASTPSTLPQQASDPSSAPTPTQPTGDQTALRPRLPTDRQTSWNGLVARSQTTPIPHHAHGLRVMTAVLAIHDREFQPPTRPPPDPTHQRTTHPACPRPRRTDVSARQRPSRLKHSREPRKSTGELHSGRAC